MALFNIFKKNPASAPKKLRRGEERKKVAPKEVKKEIKKEAKEAPVVALKQKKESETACRILKWPHVTEKATALTQASQYIFNVYEGANKPEIKKAVQDIYGVKVVSVKIIKIHPKPKRLGRVEGWRKAYKKAIVKLAQGQQIEILPR